MAGADERSAADTETAEWLVQIAALVEPGGNVVDIGCGEGVAAPFFVGRHHYLGVDQSEDSIARAKQLHPDGAFFAAEYARLKLPRGRADVVLAYTMSAALEPEEFALVLQRACRFVRPGGHLFTQGAEGLDLGDEFETLQRQLVTLDDGSVGVRVLGRRSSTVVIRRRRHQAGLVNHIGPLAPDAQGPRKLRRAKRRLSPAAEMPPRLRKAQRPPKLRKPPKPPRPPKPQAPQFSPRGTPWQDPWKPEDAAPLQVDVAISEAGTASIAAAGGPAVGLMGWTGDGLSRQLDGVRPLDVRAGRPPVYRFENLLYDPTHECLFDEQGRRVDETTRPRLGGLSAINTAAPDVIELPESAERIDHPVVFFGPFAASKHWGVFLTEGISRLWVLRHMSELVGDAVLLGPKAKWWSDPSRPYYVDRFIAHAGLDTDRFLKLERPVWLREVYVPHPSFVLLGQAFTEHGGLPELVAEEICGISRARTDQPVYLTRRALPPERSRVDNELDLESYLERRGVKVVSPESLSYEDQVRLVNHHSTFIGCIGSALHTLLYVLPDRPVRSIVATPGTDHFANYVMIDLLKSIEAIYVYSEPAAARRGVKQGGQQDGRAIAEQLEALGLI